MIATILGAFRVGEIRTKILFTAVILLLYRIGTHIPAPGINTQAVNAISKNLGGNSILGLLNLFSGGGLGRIAIFALGIMPYITASIILQLLQAVVPSLEKLSKEGEVGQTRITQYTRYLTVGLAFAQSIGYVFLFRSYQQSAGVSLITNFTLFKVFLIVISLTAGSTWSSIVSSRSVTACALRITARASLAVALMFCAASATAVMAPGNAARALACALPSSTAASSAASRSDRLGIRAMLQP